MLVFIPDGDDLAEVGWTDAARQKSIQTRMARAYGKSRPAGFGRKPKVASGGGGGGGGGGTPKKTGTTTNAAGEQVHAFSDGGSVTVHKDGKATYTRADGSKVTGTYKEPVAKEKRPAGFTGDDDPSVIKKKERDALAAQKKAERDAKAAATKRAQAARGYYPGAAKLDKVRVSRTQKGPRAGQTTSGKALTGWRASLNPQP
jgi:hypothetical protein